MKYFFIIFFLLEKCLQDVTKKRKKRLSKKVMKGTKIFLERKKTKNADMLVSDIEIFLKKKEKRSVDMVVIKTPFRR